MWPTTGERTSKASAAAHWRKRKTRERGRAARLTGRGARGGCSWETRGGLGGGSPPPQQEPPAEAPPPPPYWGSVGSGRAGQRPAPPGGGDRAVAARDGNPAADGAPAARAAAWGLCGVVPCAHRGGRARPIGGKVGGGELTRRPAGPNASTPAAQGRGHARRAGGGRQPSRPRMERPPPTLPPDPAFAAPAPRRHDWRWHPRRPGGRRL